MRRYRLRELLMASVDLGSFRAAWYYDRFQRTGETYAEQPDEAVTIGAKAP